MTDSELTEIEELTAERDALRAELASSRASLARAEGENAALVAGAREVAVVLGVPDVALVQAAREVVARRDAARKERDEWKARAEDLSRESRVLDEAGEANEALLARERGAALARIDDYQRTCDSLREALEHIMAECEKHTGFGHHDPLHVNAGMHRIAALARAAPAPAPSGTTGEEREP